MRAWQEFIAEQEKVLGPETARRWLRTLRVIDFDAGNLYLSAKDSFQVMWFKEHIKAKLATDLVNESGRPIKVHIAVGQRAAPPKKQKKEDEAQKSAPKEFELTFDTLNPQTTFDTFVAPEEEALTLKVLSDLSGANGQEPTMELATFNPIFISGPSGSGKTHLMMATAHALRKRKINALYARAETFTEHVVGAIRNGEMHRFRNAYRNAEVLLIDNIQVLSRKAATQEELFHTFNTLHVAGKQIILAANVAPQELQHVEPRLVSRFEWGIALHTTTPTREQIEKILTSKLAALDYSLEPKVRDFLLEYFGASTVALTRALEALILRSHLESTRGALTVPVATSLLEDLLREERRHVLTPDRIVSSVAEHFGIHSDDILGKSQRRECASPRKIAMYLCRKSLYMPYVKIGDQFGRDHSTVMTSVRGIETALAGDDRELAGTVGTIQKKLQNRSD